MYPTTDASCDASSVAVLGVPSFEMATFPSGVRRHVDVQPPGVGHGPEAEMNSSAVHSPRGPTALVGLQKLALMQGVGPPHAHEPSPVYWHEAVLRQVCETHRSALAQSASVEHSVRLQPLESNSTEPHPSDLHVSSRLHHEAGGTAHVEKSQARISVGGRLQSSNRAGSTEEALLSQAVPSDFLA
jgi:hypothetical protein